MEYHGDEDYIEAEEQYLAEQRKIGHEEDWESCDED
jgi:hypothetical protein